MRVTRWTAGLLVAGSLLVSAACAGEDAQRSEAQVGVSRDMAGGAPPAMSQAAVKEAGGSGAPGASGASGTAANAAQAPVSDRKIVTNVFLDLTVKDVQGSFERISLIAEGSGGLVADANLRTEKDERRASVTVRVPAPRVQDVLTQVRGLAVKVDSERVNANDVTEEFTDVQARLRNLEATEQQLLVFLGQAKSIQDVLQVQDRLTSTRQEIERLKGRVNVLTRLSDLATIQMQLHGEPVLAKDASPRNPLEALGRGWQASLDVLGGLALGALTVAAFSWWLLPVAALLVWVWRRERGRRRAGGAAA